MARETEENHHDKASEPLAQGGEVDDDDIWKSTQWEDKNSNSKQRMNVELGHKIFGHRSTLTLLNGSKHEVWDDISFVNSGDSWCDMCKIANAKRCSLK